MLVNRNSSNEQLAKDETVRTALDGGNVILIDKQVTSNPNYTTLFIAGYVETPSSSSVNHAQAELLGWGTNSAFIGRCVQNAKTEIADKLPLGKVFEDFALQVVDHKTPQYEGHTPRMSNKGEVYFAEDGSRIYRSFVLTTKEELAEQGHIIIKRMPVSNNVSVNAAKLLETA